MCKNKNGIILCHLNQLKPGRMRASKPGDIGYGWGGGGSHYYTNLPYNYDTKKCSDEKYLKYVGMTKVDKESIAELKSDLIEFEGFIIFEEIMHRAPGFLLFAMKFILFIRDDKSGKIDFGNSNLRRQKPIEFFFQLSPDDQDSVCRYYNDTLSNGN